MAIIFPNWQKKYLLSPVLLWRVLAAAALICYAIQATQFRNAGWDTTLIFIGIGIGLVAGAIAVVINSEKIKENRHSAGGKTKLRN